jgi:hypothetical protein
MTIAPIKGKSRRSKMKSEKRVEKYPVYKNIPRLKSVTKTRTKDLGDTGGRLKDGNNTHFP